MFAQPSAGGKKRMDEDSDDEVPVAAATQ